MSCGAFVSENYNYYLFRPYRRLYRVYIVLDGVCDGNRGSWWCDHGHRLMAGTMVGPRSAGIPSENVPRPGRFHFCFV